MEKAQKLLQKGKIRETIGVLNQVIEVDPTDFRVLLKKSELESRVGDIDAAKESYNRVAEQYSNDGFYLKAIAIYKKILKLDPDEFGIYSKLAQLYRKLGLDTEAKKQLKVVAEYYKVKGLRTNYQEIVLQLSELGESVSESQISMVESFVKEGDRDRAIEQFRAMSEKFHESGNMAQLDVIVKKMDELQIRDLDVYIMQAKLYLNGKEPKKALQMIQRAYAMQPQNPATLELLGQCFVELSQPQKAISVYNELSKIFDRSGDMRGLSRIKNELVKLDDPIAELNKSEGFYPGGNSNEINEIEAEDDSDDVKYETVGNDKSEEFVIEEVEAPAYSKKSDVSFVDRSKIAQEESVPEMDLAVENVGEVDLLDGVDDEDDSFTRAGDEEENPNNLSFMNIIADSFSSAEDLGISDTEQGDSLDSEPTKEPQKAEQKTRPLKLEDNMGGEESIGFETISSFQFPSNELSEATKIDDERTTLDRPKSVKSSGNKTGILEPFRDDVQESTTLETPANLELVDFEKFYSTGEKEKSEISVYEEEFVSVSDFLDEASGPSDTKEPEKIEIHDRVEKPKPSNIKYPDLEKNALTADIESTLDFSNINMPKPGEDLDEPSQGSKDIMNLMLSDPEPEDSLAKNINLDEKTMLDVRQEFQENAKNEPGEGSFFDLSEELKDEISEFEKNFGNDEEDGEEEYLSPEEVILEFKKGIARTIDKNDHQTHYDLAVAYKEMGLIDEAISAFELAASNPATKVDAVSMIGICLGIKNDHEKAIHLYQQIIPTMSYQDPKCLGLTYQLGEAFIELGRHMEAYKAFSRIKDTDPTFRDVKSRTKELAFNLGIEQKDPQQYAGKMVVDLKNRKKNKI